ncbi:carbohydrate ABC transporter permease [Arenivirga flava]|uniref:Sugar ABC transporter permease n=1 Tax=Arenivirga flava TaxID=1930060 RepID=A0AA37X837_9MICO|nr:sugar ABC transporter permease [Arenivirga flava]GMA27104.1 sugar ABC transporter permease [Arenivirga flava]
MTTTAPRASARPEARRRPRSTAVSRAPWILLAPFLALFGLTFLLPIVVAIGQSFTSVTREGLFGEAGVTSQFAWFDNYRQALEDGNFIASIGRMFLFGIVQVPIMIVLCTILALLLESAAAKLPGLFRAAYFLPYGIPGVIATILWSFLYVPGLSPIIDIASSAFGLQLDFLGAGTVLWSIANIVTWTYTGYNMMIIIAQLKAIPTELYEAARVDGAGPWRIARSIQLPLIRPALVLTTVFSIIGTLQLFAEAQLLQVVSPAIDSQYTPNLSAYTTAFAYNDYNVAAAQSVLIALVAFVLSFVFLRLTNRSSK